MNIFCSFCLVDILINAWDHTPPYTFLIITGDRDLAYAVSMLRTRRYRVIIICPTSTHLDLTAQASAQLDWSRVALGMVGGPTEPPEHPLPPKEPPTSYGMRRQSEATNDTRYTSATRNSASRDRGMVQSGAKPAPEPPMAEHNGPLRGRRNSLFSSYDARKYSVFGDSDRDYPAANVGIGTFGLGDGPLFPRTRSQGGEQSRADSAPPNIQYSTNPPTPLAATLPLSSSIKGKQKDAQIYAPENIFPLIPLEFPQNVPYSGSIFEPFGSSDPFLLSKSPPRQATDKPAAAPNMSPSSVKSDSVTRFSAFHTEVSTAPTSAEPPSLADKSDLTIKPLSSPKKDSPKPKLSPPLIDDVVPSSRQNSETANSATGSATASKIDEYTKESKASSPLIHELSAKPGQSASPSAKPSESTPVAKTPKASPPPVAPASKPPPPPKTPVPPQRSRANTVSTPIPVSAPSTPEVPAIYAILARTLREERKSHPHGVPKSYLGAALLKRDANIYNRVGFSRFGQYIAAATAAGVVSEKKGVKGEPCVALHPSYA